MGKIRPPFYTVVLLVEKFIPCVFKSKRRYKSKSRCYWLQQVFPVEILHIFDAPSCVVLPQVISDSKRCDICSLLILYIGQHYVNHCCQMQMQPVTKRSPFSRSSFMSRWEQRPPAWANTDQLHWSPWSCTKFKLGYINLYMGKLSFTYSLVNPAWLQRSHWSYCSFILPHQVCVCKFSPMCYYWNWKFFMDCYYNWEAFTMIM